LQQRNGDGKKWKYPKAISFISNIRKRSCKDKTHSKHEEGESSAESYFRSKQGVEGTVYQLRKRKTGNNQRKSAGRK